MKNTLNLHIPEQSRAHWEKISFTKRIGTAVPLFSLRSENRIDLGIGDIGTLNIFIDNCSTHNLEVIQLLPINETSPHDNSPFGAISAFALNPIYADMEQLFTNYNNLDLLHIISANKETFTLYKKVNNASRVNYIDTRELKYRLFNISYENFIKSDSNQELKNDFTKFCIDNRFWLESYTLFKYLKEINNWYAIKDWPEADRIYSDKLYKKYYRTNQNELDQYAYIQWVLFEQSRDMHKYAAAKNVLIKGDIPLLVSKESSDVWQYPQYFDTQLKAGAPPDFYCADGQDWGLPVYNWTSLEKDNYSWWKKRLKYAENFYDLYRIDHVLGLFRIWVIPENEPAINGYFLPKEKETWEAHGKKLLSLMLENSTMLPIAEDLGIVPPIVRKVLAELGIPGYKVMIMEHHKPTEVFDPIALLSTSTHDSATLMGLWGSLPEKEKHNFCAILGIQTNNYEIDDHLHELLLNKLVTNTPASFVILPLQDILGHIPGVIGIDLNSERINTPGTMGDQNWSFRFPPYELPQIQQKLNKMAQLSTSAKTQFTNWINSKKPARNNIIVDVTQLDTDLEFFVDGKEFYITAPLGGMARIIETKKDQTSFIIKDLPMVKYQENEYGIKVIAPRKPNEIKITFFWRISNDKYEWEGKDYKIRFK